MSEKDDNWYALFSLLYDLKQHCSLLLHDGNSNTISNITPQIKGLLHSIDACFSYGIIEEDDDATLRVYHDLLTSDEDYKKAEELILSQNNNSLSCQLSWICYFLNTRSFFNVINKFTSDESIHSFYSSSLFTNSRGSVSFVNLMHALDTLSFDLPLSISDPYLTESESESNAAGLLSRVVSSLFSVLHDSIEFLDLAVDNMFTSSAKQLTSSEPSHLRVWLQPDSNEHFKEPIFCVPRILSCALNALQQNWTTEDIHALCYEQAVVLDIIEYYGAKNRLPSDISGVQALNIVLYMIQSLPNSLIPSQHYESLLNALLSFDKDMIIQSLNSFLLDLDPVSKVIIDRIVTAFSQLIITYSNNEFEEELTLFCKYITPSFFTNRLDHEQEEGELKACEEMMQILLLHSTDILTNIHKDIDAINIRVNDKKLRIRSLVDLLDQQVTSDPESLSLRLLRRLWNHTIGMYYQAQGSEIPAFSPISPYWKMIGFQRETPLTDFRGGGILSLMHLLAFVERYPLFVLDLIGDANELKLPLAIACINLSILLVKALDLYSIDGSSDVTQLSTKSVWPLVTHPSFLNEMFVCLATETFSLFRPGEPFFLQFTPLLQEVASVLNTTFQDGVSSVEAFCEVLQKHARALRQEANGLTFHKNDEDHYIWLQTSLITSPSSIHESAKEALVEPEEESVHIKLLTNSPSIHPSVLSSIQSQLASHFHLPERPWSLVYRTTATIHSLTSFLQVARGVSHTLLVISDLNGELIGSYQEEAWRVSSYFHGHCKCCVFSMIDGKITFYPARNKNTMYQLSNDQVLAIGGGSQHAIMLSSNMRFCSTGECTTFNSPQLSCLSNFECAVIELWKL